MKEWEEYEEFLNEHNLYNSTYWYDVKGNHDCVKNKNANYFYDYSVTGKLKRGEVYDFYKNTSHASYHFIGMDTTSSQCIY